MHRFAVGVAVLCLFTGCSLLPQTSKNQVRGTVPAEVRPADERAALGYLHGNDEYARARQITAEHSSVEYYKNFSVGILEITDNGTVNPLQKQQVFDMLEKELASGGLLVVFAHGWHHGARTCDRDLCCFRTVLDLLQDGRVKRYPDYSKGQRVVGVYIGWRGESFAVKGINNVTIYDRKRTAERLGKSSAKELLLEINETFWRPYKDKVTMVSVGHSLGGALLFQAAKETLTGNISDIEHQNVRSYRVVRSDCSRKEALDAKPRVKARRAGFGDLIILVNPALEANEYRAFDDDLLDRKTIGWTRKQLTDADLPYDKNEPYPGNQLPVLVALASTADSAVGTIFPISRVLMFPLKPSVLYRANERYGIGHYAPHVTHHLGYPALDEKELEKRKPREAARENCDCPMKTAAVPVTDKEDEQLDLSKTEQTFGEDKKYSLRLTKDRATRGWDVNSPYMVIETERAIMSEHSDIFNEYFVGFLSLFMDAYYTKFDREGNADCSFTAPAGTQVMR